MSPRDWWRRWWHARDHSAEARHHLRRLDARHAEVERLGADAAEQLRSNHFSEMITAAISRRRSERDD